MPVDYLYPVRSTKPSPYHRRVRILQLGSCVYVMFTEVTDDRTSVISNPKSCRKQQSRVEADDVRVPSNGKPESSLTG